MTMTTLLRVLRLKVLRLKVHRLKVHRLGALEDLRQDLDTTPALPIRKASLKIRVDMIFNQVVDSAAYPLDSHRMHLHRSKGQSKKRGLYHAFQELCDEHLVRSKS